jgi:hypothetical protein
MDGLRLNGENRVKNIFSSFKIHIAIESSCRVALSGLKMQNNELKCQIRKKVKTQKHKFFKEIYI